MSRHRRAVDASVRRLLLSADLIGLAVALILAAGIRSLLAVLGASPPFEPLPHLVASVALLGLIPAFLSLVGHYDADRVIVSRGIGPIGSSVLWSLFIVSAFTVPWDQEGHLLSRTWLVAAPAASVAGLIVARRAVSAVLSQRRISGDLRRGILIVGTSSRTTEIAQHVVLHPETGVTVLGFLDEHLPIGREVVAGIQVVGRPVDLLRGRFAEADECVVDGAMVPPWIMDEIAAAAGRPNMPRIRQVLGRTELARASAPAVGHVLGPVVTLGAPGGEDATTTRRRILDVNMSLLLLVGVAPIALAVMVRARLRGIRPLTNVLWIAGADGQPVPMRLLRPEVTSLAALRGWPALAAVLRGQLSVVGPRPIVMERGHADAGWVSGVRPGLTGAWRLATSDAPVEEADRRDLGYLSAYSMWEDVAVVYETAARSWRRGGPEIQRWGMAPVPSAESVGSGPQAAPRGPAEA